jgi:peptidoglycan-associated lipoprotein
MFLKKKTSITAALILSLGLGLTACSGDEEKPAEPVEPVAVDEPVQPPVEAAAPTENFTAENVLFAYDQYTLTSDSQSRLTALADNLKGHATAVAQIEGHCDERGSIEYNLALGEKRAQSVKSFLVNLGIPEARLTTISYGEEKPAAEGHDEGAWSKNRRAEFVISAQ